MLLHGINTPEALQKIFAIARHHKCTQEPKCLDRHLFISCKILTAYVKDAIYKLVIGLDLPQSL